MFIELAQWIRTLLGSLGAYRDENHKGLTFLVLKELIV